MKKIICCAIAAAALCLNAEAGKVYFTTESKTELNSIECGDDIVVKYVPAENAKGVSVECSAEQGDPSWWNVSLKNGKLKLYRAPAARGENRDGVLTVTVKGTPSLENVTLSGSAKMIIDDDYKSKHTLTIVGSGYSSYSFNNLEVSGSNKKLNLELDGGCNLKVNELNCCDMGVVLTGTSRLKADKIDATDVRIECGGLSAIEASGIDITSAEIILDGGSKLSADVMDTTDMGLHLMGSSSMTVNSVDANGFTLRANGITGFSAKNLDVTDADITLEGSASFKLPSTFECTDFILTGMGTTSFVTDKIDCSAFTTNLAGMSKLQTGGVDCTSFSIGLEGSSQAVLGNVACTNASCEVEGSSGLQTTAFNTGELDVQVSGFSQATLAGVDATNTFVNTEGNGRVTLSGKSNSLRMKTSRQGRVDVSRLKVDNSQEPSKRNSTPDSPAELIQP